LEEGYLAAEHGGIEVAGGVFKATHGDTIHLIGRGTGVGDGFLAGCEFEEAAVGGKERLRAVGGAVWRVGGENGVVSGGECGVLEEEVGDVRLGEIRGVVAHSGVMARPALS